MALNADDRTAINDLICRHGLLVDTGQLDRMHELFTTDVRYDVTDLGGGVITGLAALHDATIALGDAHPVGHHITNVVLTATADDRVRAESKAIAIHANGTCASATYDDTVVRGPDGWRITHRTIRARRTPLSGAATPATNPTR